MRPDGQSRRAFLGALGGLGALSVTGSARGDTRPGTGWAADATSRTDGLQASCMPGHDEGDSACDQIRDDAAVLTPFDARETDLVTRFSYPCGWAVGTTTYDDRIQANASRHDIGEVGASVDVQVRNFTEPVDKGVLDAKREEGDYDDVEYDYAGRTRTSIVSSPDTAQFGTTAHAVVPAIEGEGLRHVELISTMHGGECVSPRPDYRLVRDMLLSIEPNREPASVTFDDQAVSSEVETQAVTIANVTLPDGGYVVVHSTPLQQNDLAASVVGASSYLSRGDHQNVRIALDTTITETTDLVAMPHRDTDGDVVYEFGDPSFAGDGPYDTGNGPVIDRATITPVTDTPVPEETYTPTATLEPLDSPTPTGTPASSAVTDPSSTAIDGTTDATGPGFGIAGTLSGIAVGSALWLRRQLGDDEQ